MISKVTVVYVLLSIISLMMLTVVSILYKDKRFIKFGMLPAIGIFIIFYILSLIIIVIERIKLSGI